MEKKLIKRYLICGTLILTGLSSHTLFAQTLSEAAALLNMQSNSAPKAASSLKAQSDDLVKAAALLDIQVKKPVKVPDSVNARIYVYSDQEIIPARLKANSETTASDDVISHLDNLVKGALISQKAALVSKQKTKDDQEVAAAQKAVAALKTEQRAARLKRFQQAAAQKTDKAMPAAINSSKAEK